MKMVQEIAQVSDAPLNIMTAGTHIIDTMARGRRRHELHETSGSSQREDPGIKSRLGFDNSFDWSKFDVVAATGPHNKAIKFSAVFAIFIYGGAAANGLEERRHLVA